MLGVVGSHSAAIRLADLLKTDGIPVHVVSTPRQYADSGCSYSIRFGKSYYDTVIKISKKSNINVYFV